MNESMDKRYNLKT